MKKTKSKKPTLAQRVEQLEKDKTFDIIYYKKLEEDYKILLEKSKYAKVQIDRAAQQEAQRVQKFCPFCNRQIKDFTPYY